MATLRLLVLEPYYGGSHQAFLDGLADHLPFELELLTLPPRRWKWRMRLAAPYFAEKMQALAPFEGVLCSSFVDVATLRGLGPGWLQQVPLFTYFHENQFTYPVRQAEPRDLHFGLTNYTTALASDRLAFNSSHNFETFLEGIRTLPRLGCDLRLQNPEAGLRTKTTILPPGLDFSDIDQAAPPRKISAPVLVWNHRWEHDKNPDRFFETLFQLDREGLDFRLIVLGQSFARQPAVFAEVRQRLGHRLLHFGFAPDRQEYIFWLRQGDLVVSTAEHEFYGLAVLEAVRAGCRPLLPDRLSYPELFPPQYLYQEEDLACRLAAEIRCPRPLSPAEARQLTGRFSWPALTEKYTEWFTGYDRV